jgi:flagellar basal-body rod modification protein FlgD
MAIDGVSASRTSAGVLAGGDPTQGLGGDDFFKLLIAQLVNQDPLEPTSNQDLLNQISSIRDIELSTSLSSSLGKLSDQQRFASAASLIGRYVSGASDDESGAPINGIVQSVRFDAEGKAILQLEDGQEIPLESVASVMEGARAAEALIGRFVTGLDRTDPADPQIVEGIATGVSTDASGRIMIELDTGDQLRLTDVVDAQSEEAAEAA